MMKNIAIAGFQLTFYLGIAALLIGCHSSDSSFEKKQSETVPLNRNISSCSTHIEHQNPAINRAYKESFSMLGAYLLKYQEILKNQEDAAVEFNKINKRPKIEMMKDGKFFDTKIDDQGIGDLSQIDKNMDNPHVRNIWQKWCIHPDNFLSWLLYPLRHIESNNIEELATKSDEFGYAAGRNLLIHWIDDGFWTMSHLIGIKIEGAPQWPWTADPEKWLIRLDGDQPVTK